MTQPDDTLSNWEKEELQQMDRVALMLLVVAQRRTITRLERELETLADKLLKAELYKIPFKSEES